VNKLDAFWQSLPTADRYLINGKRWAVFWRDGKGELLPLAECAEQIKEAECRSLQATGDLRQ
jgi:hypothetical protein